MRQMKEEMSGQSVGICITFRFFMDRVNQIDFGWGILPSFPRGSITGPALRGR